MQRVDDSPPGAQAEYGFIMELNGEAAQDGRSGRFLQLPVFIELHDPHAGRSAAQPRLRGEIKQISVVPGEHHLRAAAPRNRCVGSHMFLLAVYGKNSEAIWKKVPRFHGIIAAYEDQWREVHAQHDAGDIDAERRDLIMEGLVARFLDELVTLPEPEEEDAPALEGPTGFAAHVAKQRDETPDA